MHGKELLDYASAEAYAFLTLPYLRLLGAYADSAPHFIYFWLPQNKLIRTGKACWVVSAILLSILWRRENIVYTMDVLGCFWELCTLLEILYWKLHLFCNGNMQSFHRPTLGKIWVSGRLDFNVSATVAIYMYMYACLHGHTVNMINFLWILNIGLF